MERLDYLPEPSNNRQFIVYTTLTLKEFITKFFLNSRIIFSIREYYYSPNNYIYFEVIYNVVADQITNFTEWDDEYIIQQYNRNNILNQLKYKFTINVPKLFKEEDGIALHQILHFLEDRQMNYSIGYDDYVITLIFSQDHTLRYIRSVINELNRYKWIYIPAGFLYITAL